jgi:hypothetical protein
MRVGIIRLNAAHGLVETPERGYHETLTRAWLIVVGAAMRTTPELTESRAFVDAHGEAFVRTALRRYYTPEHMLTPIARARFVEPDVAPLPEA